MCSLDINDERIIDSQITETEFLDSKNEKNNSNGQMKLEM